jgi:hypothetical protein
MQTILDSAHTEQEWLVKLTAGMPGGIGNTGFECGGITSPLVLMGLRYGLGHEVQGLPLIFYKGCDLCDRFLSCHQTLICREIRGEDRLPLRCIPVIQRSPERLVEAIASDSTDTFSEEKREAYCRLYAHLAEKGFHCSHAVFQYLEGTIPVSQELLDASSGFLGGTLFQGRTCSAFTAGVMAVGLKIGEIENNPLRVIRMIAMMAFGGNAFDDSVNKFNKPMNTGYRISEWFSSEFGSTQCREITQCDFFRRVESANMSKMDVSPGAGRSPKRLQEKFKRSSRAMNKPDYRTPPNTACSRQASARLRLMLAVGR